MTTDKDILHKMIENIDDPAKLRMVFDAIHSILEDRMEPAELDAWQQKEIHRALKEADEGDFASSEDVAAFTKRWSHEN